jgi:ABC-type transporter Mla subunit MlaD
MRYDMNEVKVGAVILVAGVLLVAVIFAVGDYKSYFEEYYYVDAIFDSVQGLPDSAPVMYHGLEIGKVLNQESVESEGKPAIRVRIKIKHKTNLFYHSIAKITQVGFLNRPFLSILDPLTLEEKEFMPKKENPEEGNIPTIRGDGLTDFSQIAISVQKLMDEILKEIIPSVKKTIDGVNKVVHSEKMQTIPGEVLQGLKDRVEQVNTILAKVQAVVDDNREKIDGTVSNAKDASQNVKELTANAKSSTKKIGVKAEKILDNVDGTVVDSREGIKKTLASIRTEAEGLGKRIDTLQEKIEKVLDDTDDTVLHAQQIVGDATAVLRDTRETVNENRNELHAIMINLKDASDHLESLLRQLDDSPSKILFDRSIRKRSVETKVKLPE